MPSIPPILLGLVALVMTEPVLELEGTFQLGTRRSSLVPRARGQSSGQTVFSFTRKSKTC